MNPRDLCLACVCLMTGLAFFTGCDDKPASQQGDRSAPTVDDPSVDALADGGVTPGDADAPVTDPVADANPSTDADAGSDWAEPGGPAPAPDAAVDTDAARLATVDGVKRSPFPEQGERITGHIAAARLSDHDPFANEIDPEDIPDVVPWTEASEYVGHEITVEGRIVHLGQSRDGNVNFLNFDADWRDKFYMVVFNDLAETLEGGVEGTFLNKLVRVTGEVEEHRGRPQIKIESMDQVEFVDE